MKTTYNKPTSSIQNRYLILFGLLVKIFCLIFYPASAILYAAEFDIYYNVSIQGVSENNIQKYLEEVSNTVTLKDKPVASIILLQKRIQQDISKMMVILRSRSFYGARITDEVQTEESPVQVVFKVDTGSPYLIRYLDMQIDGEGAFLKKAVSFKDDMDLALDMRADTRDILSGQEKLKHWFKTRGFPFTRIDDPLVIVDHSNQSVSITFIVHSGEIAHFGPTLIQGLETVEDSFVRSKIPWREGDLFNSDFFTEMKSTLNEMGLFVTIDIQAEDQLDEEGRLPVLIRVRERKHRTIKTGIGYSTDEGISGRASWEHRNILHRGERLTVSGLASEIIYSAEALFRKPQFQRPDQTLILNVRLAEEHPEAYTSQNLTSLIKIERALSDEIMVGMGIGDRLSRVDQLGKIDRFNLLSMPLSLSWNTRNDLLDPVRGGYLDIQIAPYYDMYGSDLYFTKGLWSYQRYFQLSSDPAFVWAMRGTMGALEGTERDDVPADIRFYAGGGGSIRGYPYQSVGPMKDGVALGGRSLFALSSEIRTKINASFGLVFFVDGGNAFEETFPDLDQALYWGTGIGLRYFTPIGPLRMDVAFPLTRRESVTDSFQIYVSIGQAF